MNQTPRPIIGTWTLTAPDGRQWQADSPLLCVGLELRERVPPNTALERVLAAAEEPDPLVDENKRLREALIKLRDCDWVITLPDRMDAVRDVAREALKEDQNANNP